jgi:hypothetical protein
MNIPPWIAFAASESVPCPHRRPVLKMAGVERVVAELAFEDVILEANQ